MSKLLEFGEEVVKTFSVTFLRLEISFLLTNTFPSHDLIT